MISSSMKRMMRYTVSTKRRPAADSTGKQAAPVLHLASLKVTPIDPLNTDEFHNLILRYNIQEPYKLFGCYCETSEDVAIGDVIVWNDREFLLKGCGVWNDGPETLYEMVLTEMA